MAAIQVGTKVFATGQNGRFQVVEIKGNWAKIKLLANKKDTGEPVDLKYTVEVPISTLTVLEASGFGQSVK